ncbi:MAG: hypothetical protein FWH26_11165, partial [Oscillospiraceae bacterium]|nr:hypothetical protein [Oscillospiraceae bacterium]
LDFKAELDKLIRLETEPLPQPGGELAEILAAGRELLSFFSKKQDDISMQVEEIYDLAQEAGASDARDALRDERKQGARLAGAVIGLCDIIEDFYEFAKNGHDGELSRQALLMWRGAGRLLSECGMARIDGDCEAGRPLDPEVHAGQSMAPSPLPRGSVVSVLRSGYRHNGNVARKAAVILSAGPEGGYDE